MDEVERAGDSDRDSAGPVDELELGPHFGGDAEDRRDVSRAAPMTAENVAVWPAARVRELESTANGLHS